VRRQHFADKQVKALAATRDTLEHSLRKFFTSLGVWDIQSHARCDFRFVFPFLAKPHYCRVALVLPFALGVVGMFGDELVAVLLSATYQRLPL